jgi:hypothetical protein
MAGIGTPLALRHGEDRKKTSRFRYRWGECLCGVIKQSNQPEREHGNQSGSGDGKDSGPDDKGGDAQRTAEKR